jgi:hypothetical protein
VAGGTGIGCKKLTGFNSIFRYSQHNTLLPYATMPSSSDCSLLAITQGMKEMTIKNDEPENKMSPSFNAEVARSGNKAESDLCKNAKAMKALSTHFGKQVTEMKRIKGGKKSDILVMFEDGTTCKLQSKNGTGGGRGWSCDRRAANKLPLSTEAIRLIENLCLKKNKERFEVEQSKTLIPALMLGSEEEFKPDHFVHTTYNKKSGELTGLKICTASLLMETLANEQYLHLKAKRTCVHLSPSLYLQRKGGGKKDHAPDDIQLKLKSMPSVDGKSIMTELTLAETTPPQ